MEDIYQWVRNLTCYLIFTNAMVNLLADSRYEKYLRFFSGIVLILLVIQPLTGSLRLEERLAYLFESFSFQQESADFEKRLWGMEEERLNRVIRSYETAVAMDVAAMARAEGYAPGEIRVEIGQETGTVEYGRVKAIRMELGPEEDPLAENASGELVWIDPVQIEPEEQENRQDFAVEQEAALPQDPDLRAKLNGFARKVAGYYGLTGAEVTVEWKDDKGEVDSDVAGGSAADAVVLSAGDR